MDILLAEQCKRLIFVNKLRKRVFLIFVFHFCVIGTACCVSERERFHNGRLGGGDRKWVVGVRLERERGREREGRNGRWLLQKTLGSWLNTGRLRTSTDCYGFKKASAFFFENSKSDLITFQHEDTAECSHTGTSR